MVQQPLHGITLVARFLIVADGNGRVASGAVHDEEKGARREQGGEEEEEGGGGGHGGGVEFVEGEHEGYEGGVCE